MKISAFFEKFFHANSSLPASSETSTEASQDPRLYFSSISFDSGPTISLDPTDIIVFVGPNNAGKSRALRDLNAQTSGDSLRHMCNGALVKDGTFEEFEKFIKRYSSVSSNGSFLKRVGEGFDVGDYELKDRWKGNLRDVSRLFCQHIGTESRITDSNPPDAIATLTQVPQHPIDRLLIDDDLESRLSGIFSSAFGQELVLYRAGGAKTPLLVGRRPSFDPGEDRVSATYLHKLKGATTQLKKQGDGMRSFASVILFLLASETKTLFLLDEPEAFLHPPQAKRLGEAMANERMRPSQLFVATHSPEILTGLLSSAPEKLRIIRLERDAKGDTIATELEREKVRVIATDPVMKFSAVLDGLFHRRVIVCEADSDCLFYSSILDIPSVNGGKHPDVLFLQVGGKDRMAALVRILRDLNVTVDVIADIDVVASRHTFREICVALGADESRLSALAERVDKAVSQTQSWLSAPQMVDQIKEELGKAPSTGQMPREIKGAIERVLRKLSPWSALKEAGVAAIPKGSASADFQELLQSASASGFWIVPVGEVEGFCRAQGGHGPTWVQETLRRFRPESSSELADARAFMTDLWSRVQ